MGQEWLTRRQVAERLGVGETAVHQWCAKGLLEQRQNPPARPGLCGCGCGQRTLIAKETDARYGRIKGQPQRFIHGHNGRSRVSAASVERMKTLLDARKAVTAAAHRVAVLAGAGDDPRALRDATAALAERKTDLMLLEMEVASG